VPFLKKSLVIAALVIIVIIIVGGSVGYYSMTKPTPTGMSVTGVTSAATSGIEQVVRVGDVTASESTSMDPAMNFEDLDPIYSMYDRLVTYAPPDYSKVVPMLADSWDVSADGLTYTFHLHPGITFTGTSDPVDAAAVKFSIERAEAINGPPAWLLRPDGGVVNITSIDVLDPQTIRFTLGAVSGSFLPIMANAVSSVMDPSLIAANNGTDFGSTWLNEHSAGSGPFSLQQWTRGQELDLVANPNYWRGAVKLDKVIWLYVTEATDKIFGVERGDLDVVGGLSPDQLALVSSIPGIQLEKNWDLTTVYFGMNLKAPITLPNGSVAMPFSDSRVRMAVRLAVNYTAIVDVLGAGVTIPLGGFIPKGMLGFDPSLVINQNVAQAKALMNEAGYANGFTVTMLVPPSTQAAGVTWADMGLEVRHDLAAIGITVNVQVTEGATLLRTYRAKQAQMVMENWNKDYSDPDDFTFPFCDGSLSHRVNYDNATIDNLITQASQEVNQTKRAQLVVEAQVLLDQDGPWVFLYQPLIVTVIGAHVQPLSAFQNIFWTDYWVMYKVAQASTTTSMIMTAVVDDRRPLASPSSSFFFYA
jgi:peptide/nickel transport system substrate-binding protein